MGKDSGRGNEQLGAKALAVNNVAVSVISNMRPSPVGLLSV